ncbi:MAG: 50S ribosomal protein L19 [bacterium]|nr:50S ribosomal protein L19 [bacterium]
MAIGITIKGTPVHVGDIIRVHLRVVEGEKERIQVFEGLIISIKGRAENKMFTLRKIAVGGIGVERILAVNSPWISKVEVKKTGQVRRSKLYYVRYKSVRQVSQITHQNQ